LMARSFFSFFLIHYMYNLMLFMHATSVSTYDSVSDLVFFFI